MKLNWFKRLDDQGIFKKLGTKVFIRNGIGYGFISDAELYDNGLLEIGFGRSYSGHGDWGGGNDRAATSPLKVAINSKYQIVYATTDSFYNSTSSKEIQKVANVLKKKLGATLIITNPVLKMAIDLYFTAIPAKRHLGQEIYFGDQEHILRMFEYFTNGSDYDGLRDPINVVLK